MKKIIILTSLILFLLIGIGICSQEPPPTPPKSSEIKQDTSTQKQTNSQSKQQIANKPIPCIEKRPAQTTDTKESDNANNVDQCSSTEWNLR